jgi:hypothetical protein
MSFLTTVVLIALIATNGYSSVKSDGEEKSVKVMKFHTDIDNKNSLVEVELVNNQIEKLKIDGKEIASENFHNYKELIDGRVKNISEELVNNSEKKIKVIKINDDSSADSLKKKRIKVIVRDVENELSKLDSNIFNFEFDLDNLHEKIGKIPELMHDFEFNIPDLPNKGIKDINKKLERLERKLEKSEKELETTKKEIANTKDFIKKFKSELVKDKLINSANDEPEIEFFSDEMIVNGKSVSKQQFEKYKKMYEDIIGKEKKRELYFKMK